MPEESIKNSIPSVEKMMQEKLGNPLLMALSEMKKYRNHERKAKEKTVGRGETRRGLL
jgi:hypothetical protein